ncbi:hypothetical protein N8A90_05310 [Variovorax sp. N23]|nr:hypothetical protein [Variovorax sp. N23]
MITHYCRSAKAVANILEYGFAWVANPRRLTHFLMPHHDFSSREPQQFGMVSFTDIEPADASAHAEQFGPFGIVMTEKWAKAQQAQRVIYVDEVGPVSDMWLALFMKAYEDVKTSIGESEDSFRTMAYENKVIAGLVGAEIWPYLLQLYEYMEPGIVAHEREWRVVNKEPIYSLSSSKTEAIAAVSPPQNWAKYLNVLHAPREGVRALVCPSSSREKVLATVPEGFKTVPIIETIG